MKRVLMTGATGFVGANLTRRLLDDGHEIHLLVRPGHSPARIGAILKDVQVHVADLGDEAAVDTAVRKVRPDWVFHLAAYGAYSSQTGLDQMVRTNFHGTVNLVQACLKSGFEAFVNAGSSSEYGFKDHAPSEQEFLEPNSHYAVTKASASLFCRYTSQSRGLRLCTLRLYSVYGPYEEPTRLLPSLIVQGLQGLLPALVNPSVARDFIYIRDIEEALVRAAACPGPALGAVYNVGTGVQTSVRQVVALARQLLGIQAEPVWGSLPDRSWDSSIWVADNGKIRAELGWNPRYTFEAGFREMVNCFLADPAVRSYYQDAVSAR